MCVFISWKGFYVWMWIKSSDGVWWRGGACDDAPTHTHKFDERRRRCHEIPKDPFAFLALLLNTHRGKDIQSITTIKDTTIF